jgi:hypothetical protein
MATAELSQTAPRQLPSELREMWLRAYGAIWLATLGGGSIVALGGRLNAPARHLLGLRLRADQTPTPRLGHVVALAAHNMPIAAWPLLLGVVGAHRHDLGRRAADAVLAGSIAVNVLPVGAALGAYGAALLPYIPQLPLEWAGLALGASAWLTQRRHPLTIRGGLTLLALTAIVLLCAATVETAAVPHRRDAELRRNSWGGLDRRPIDIQGRTPTGGARA